MSCCLFTKLSITNKPGIQQVQQLLTFRVQHHVVLATKPVHRLQICPIVHN